MKEGSGDIKKWSGFIKPPNSGSVPRDVWQGEGDLCQEITRAMEGIDAAGATGILAGKGKGKNKNNKFTLKTP